MKVCKTKQELKQEMDRLGSSSLSVGFVPTMGALHAGHISLFQKARQENQIVVASVFVNPLQFNNTQDLENYPRHLETDLVLLEKAACDLVFAPLPQEIYPQGETVESYHFGALENVMEGKNRPGHFNGVGVIVGRLFCLIKPHRAYFGEKDFQQVAIVQDLVRQMGQKVQIVPCPTVREKDGLALSSRNALLNPEQRASAPLIYQTLQASEAMSHHATLSQVKAFVEKEIGLEPQMELEYFEIANAHNMQSLENWKEAEEQVGCIVVKLGNVRLIDNIRYHIA